MSATRARRACAGSAHRALYWLQASESSTPGSTAATSMISSGTCGDARSTHARRSLFCGLGTLGLAISATSDSVAGTEIQLDAAPNAAPSLASYRAIESAPSVRCAWPWLSCPCVTLAPRLYRLSLIFRFGSVSNICSSVNRRVSIVGVAHGVLQHRDERVDIPAEIPNIDREEYNVAVCGGSSQASNLEPVGREHEKAVSALERRSVNQKLIDVARCGTPVPGLVLGVSNWRWCADAGRPTRFKPSSPSPTDAARDGSAKLGHPVQNVTREHGLTPLPR